MESIISSAISSLSPSALPIVVCVLGCVFIYFKIGRDRKQTKTERDNEKDELDKRLTLVEQCILHEGTGVKEWNKQSLRKWANQTMTFTIRTRYVTEDTLDINGNDPEENP